jgi:membrane-associated phospholipid phosphatase
MQPRPCFDTRQVQLALKNNKRFLYKDGLPYDLFGMPSGHASGVIFSTLFVYFALRKTNWLYVYLVISFIVISERVVYNHHTISQVVVGSFLGVLLAYGMFELAQRKMKGRIREKPDDFGPL